MLLRRQTHILIFGSVQFTEIIFNKELIEIDDESLDTRGKHLLTVWFWTSKNKASNK